jgi:eukaryotic-like serine/threonine-protein kinase
MTADENSKIPLGSVLVDKYRITREIGRGGMAAVYEAENVDIGKRVAVKVLSAELVTSRIVRERFLREARAAAAIRSPYICDVYDVGEFDNRPFLVMELLEGESLYDRMTRARRLDIPTTLKIVTQTAKGLAKAHAAGVVHRDLKPENLFLTRNEDGDLVTKLLDFGLAKFYAPTDAADQVRLTREGALFGTPAYMSPEQAKGRGEVDHRSDLWALGCIVYECLTGHTVWSVEQGVAMILAQVASAPLPVPSRLRADLPPAFDHWFEKALQRVPEDRFQSAAQFTITLTDVLAPGDSGHVQTPSLLVDVDDVLQHVAERRIKSDPSVQTSVPADFLAKVGQPPSAVAPDAAVAAQAANSPGQVAPGLAATNQLSSGSLERKGSPLAVALLLLVVAGIGGSLYFYRTQLPLPFLSNRGKTVVETTTPQPSSSASNVPLESGGFSDTVVEAQAALAAGNSDEAVRLLDDAVKNGGEGIATNLRGHIRSALETPNGPCHLRAIGRPRPFSVSDPVSRPTIASAETSAMVLWVDAHEDKVKRQVFSTLVDSAMRRVSGIQLVSPESFNARYPELLQFGTQRILLYWDATGREPGIFSRLIDAAGRVQGGLKHLAPLAKDEYAPALARDDDGSMWLTWEDDGADGAQNLLLRHFDANFNALGRAVALTALRPDRAQHPSAVRPAIAVSHGKIRILFTLRQGSSRKVHALVMATKAAELDAGVAPVGSGTPTEHKFLAPLQAMGRDGSASDDARIACEKDTCFALWGEDAAGIVATAIDAKSDEQLWRHEIGLRGTRPAIGIGPDRLLVAWFEASRVRVATADRYGVGTVSTVGKVSGLQPLPDVAKAREPNQWLLAWRDFEAGHFEIISATVECRKDDRGRP